MTMPLTKRVHRIGRQERREEIAAAVPDHMAAGEAWARLSLLLDGTVVAEGRRGRVTLTGELAETIQRTARNLGIKERAR